MASSNGNRRVNSRTEKYEHYAVYEGNAVRKIQAIPQETPVKRPVSRTTSKNRAKAQKVGKGYVLFLAVVSAATVCMCVNYLRVKSVITTQTKEIAVMESNLSELKADNDAYYNAVLASVNMEYIKNVAMNEMGMNYPTEEQIYEFDTAGNSYVRQYQNIPNVE